MIAIAASMTRSRVSRSLAGVVIGVRIPFFLRLS
jgi:hypothetical protein